MREGNSVLCSKQEAAKLTKSLQIKADGLCKELNEMCNPEKPISVIVRPLLFTTGYGVTAVMYFGEEKIKAYPLAELALLDLNALILKKTLERM